MKISETKLAKLFSAVLADDDVSQWTVNNVDVNGPISMAPWDEEAEVAKMSTEDLRKNAMAMRDDDFQFIFRDAEGNINFNALRVIDNMLRFTSFDDLPGQIKSEVMDQFNKLKKSVDERLGSTDVEKSWQGRIVKSDAAEQKVFLPVLVPDELDTQEDKVRKSEVEIAAHQFMVDYSKGEAELGLDHKTTLDRSQAQLVESWCEKTDAQYGNDVIKAGTWMVGIHISDPDIWASVVTGERTGASIEGVGIRTPLNV